MTPPDLVQQLSLNWLIFIGNEGVRVEMSKSDQKMRKMVNISPICSASPSSPFSYSCLPFTSDIFSMAEYSPCPSPDSPEPNPKYTIATCEHTFGMATKERSREPSMFELLSWENNGFNRSSFKKREKFNCASDAYMNMIGKSEWVSEAKENYQAPASSIQADPDKYEQIQQYIEGRNPQEEKKGGLKKKRKPENDQVIEAKQQAKYDPKKYKNSKTTKEAEEVQKTRESYVHRQSTKKQQRSASVDMRAPQGNLKRNNSVRHLNKPEAREAPRTPKPQRQSFERQPTESCCSEFKQKQLIEQFKQTTRWIPNSAFTTYFGKPPFENYGRGNTKPTDGGLVYGTYMYSHSVHPHRGSNQPQNIQSYPVALKKAQSQGTLTPAQPRTLPEESAVYESTPCAPIEPLKNTIGSLDIEEPDLRQVSKFGGLRKVRGH